MGAVPPTVRPQMTERPLRVGDVCLDLAQGRPVQIISDPDQTAAEWSESNNYDLVGNYGNSRLGATEEDAVFDVVYVSNLKNQPKKSYAFPESRLGRIEVEAAEEAISSIQEEILFDFLVALIQEGQERDLTDLIPALDALLDPETVQAAEEVADGPV